MKVKFNKPNRRYTNKFSFDNNTTFGIGNVQPLFCKQLCAGSKMSVTFNQLTRLSPLVVPTFARLKQRNDFVFVPMSMVMPGFDAFLSRSLINGTKASYIPRSVPCTTNVDLLCSLLKNFSFASFLRGEEYQQALVGFDNSFGQRVEITNFLYESTKMPSISDLPYSYFDFVLDNKVFVTKYYNDGSKSVFKLTSAGRFWLSVLRGLGYTLDPNDTMPVSILPLWAFAKAYYDVYYPKRNNPWHASNYYAAINLHYNGDVVSRTVGGLDYDMVKNYDVLASLFGSTHTFDFYSTIDDSLVTAATDSPINVSSSAGTQTSVFDNTNFNFDTADYSKFDVEGSPNGISSDSPDNSFVPSLNKNMVADGSNIGITADQLRLVDKLWNFVQKSSVVGQSVKDWFVVHLGVKPNEDMFDQTILVDSIVNDVSINTVISTAQTTDGSKGDNLGALAGQGYAAKSGSVKFDAKTFGFFMCLTSLVPVSGVSCGTQPELYQNTIYEQQLPDFDGLGYEVLNKSSFEESIVSGNGSSSDNGSIVGGFGYVPRLSSWKCLHNIRSGNFAVNSVKDSLLPYNVDVLPIRKTTAGSHWRFPWALHNDFISFNRIFYNVEPPMRAIGIPQAPLDDNFMCQTSFDVSYTSYLKPLSDSYSVESLGKDLVSVKEQ